MSAEGVGDGAGVSVDLSIEFFQKITNIDLKAGQFGVGNFFMPNRHEQRDKACQLIASSLADIGLKILAKIFKPISASDEAINWHALSRCSCLFGIKKFPTPNCPALRSMFVIF